MTELSKPEIFTAKQFVISCANNSVTEIQAAKNLRNILSHYQVPRLTSNVVVKDKAIPHSHPVLTISARSLRQESLLEIFCHEQMHWFFDQDETRRDTFLKPARIEFQPTSDKFSPSNPDSFWEHIAVIWNTVNILRSQLEEPAVKWVFGGPHRPYPHTEKLVFDDFENIGVMLSKHSLIFSLDKLI